MRLSSFRASVLSAAVLCVFDASAVRAADLPSSTPPNAPPPGNIYSPIPMTRWSGLYAGSFIGGALGSFTTSQQSKASGDGFGFTSGAIIGYAFQSGRVIYGLEGDIGSNSASETFAAQPGLAANEADSIVAGHARVRLGYDMGWIAPFVAGGLAVDRTTQYLQSPSDNLGASRNLAGLSLGVGVDAKVQMPVLGRSTIRVEYLYDNLGSAAYDLGGTPASTKVGMQTFRLALITPVGEGVRRDSLEVMPADWAGSYIGALGGAERQSVTTKGYGASDSLTASGFSGGVYSGKNWMFGRTMLGYEGSTMLASTQGTATQPGAPTSRYRDYFDGALRARAGYAIGRFMPFVAAGLGFDEAEQWDVTNGRFRDNIASASATFGVGVDTMVSDRVSLRVEYLHSNSLGSTSTHLEPDCCEQTQSSDMIRLGLAYFMH